jgi:S1-C subfamily serine protease
MGFATRPISPHHVAVREVRRYAALLLLALGLLPLHAYAVHLVQVGDGMEVPTDKVMIDTDSIQKSDDGTLFDIVFLYASPRTNAHQITMDRHVVHAALRCADRSYVEIRIVGFLGGKQVGSSPEKTDWQSALKKFRAGAFEDRIVNTVCGHAPNGAADSTPKLSTGSGFVIDTQAHVLTNNHVVNHCKSLAVKAPEFPPVAAMVEAVDPKNDLALLRAASGATLGEPVRFRNQSEPPKLGEAIGVVGFPLPSFLSSEPKATFGQINSVAGMNNDYTVLQISAPVQPGNSGGPVLDASGMVVGVVVAQAGPAVAAASGSAPQNVNFAIRGEIAQIFLNAHGVKYAAGKRGRHLETDEVAAVGEKSIALVVCVGQ